MPRGRPRNATPTVQWSIMMPIDLALQIETELADPVTQRALYASRSKLIQALLLEWLLGRRRSAANPIDKSA